MEKKFYQGVIAIFTWILLIVATICFQSCGSSEEKKVPTKVVTLKMIDLVETVESASAGRDSWCYTVYHVLLENGQMVTLGNQGNCCFGHRLDESTIRKIMAFRRGETVYLTVEVPLEAAASQNKVDVPYK